MLLPFENYRTCKAFVPLMSQLTGDNIRPITDCPRGSPATEKIELAAHSCEDFLIPVSFLGLSASWGIFTDKHEHISVDWSEPEC